MFQCGARCFKSDFRFIISSLMVGLVLSCNSASFSGDSGASDKKSSPAAQMGGDNQEAMSKPEDEAASANSDSGKVIYDDGTSQKPQIRSVKQLPGTSDVVEQFKAQDAKDSFVDIVFVMDSSSSMEEEKTSLEEQMSGFLRSLTSSDPRLDYRVFVIGTGFSFRDIGDQKRIQLVPWSVGSFDALEVLRKFLTDKPALDLPLRDGVTKEAVIISDQDAKTEFHRNFEIFSLAHKGTIHMNGFVGLPNSRQTPTCQISGAGRAYINIAKSHGGLIQDICRDDWGLLLGNLATSIAKEHRILKYSLAFPMEAGRSLRVKIDGKEITSDGFRYDDSSGPLVIFTPSSAPLSSQTVEISYVASK